MKPTEEQIHEASRAYYGAFDHMLHDWKPVAGFKAGAKWAISQQDDVIEKVKELRDKKRGSIRVFEDVRQDLSVYGKTFLDLTQEFITELNAIIEKP